MNRLHSNRKSRAAPQSGKRSQTGTSGNDSRGKRYNETLSGQKPSSLRAEVEMKDEIRCVVPTGDICGEGAVWHSEQRALYWTDINRFLVHRFEPHSQTTQTWFFEEPVTSVNLATDPEILLLVFASRVGLWSPRAHPHIQSIFRLPTAPQMRFNDARVDPRGSLWAGTMRNNVGPSGEDLAVEFTGG